MIMFKILALDLLYYNSWKIMLKEEIVMQIDGSKVISHINSKWSGRACPMCDARKFSVQDKVYQLMEFHKDAGLMVGGPIIPLIPVSCENCGVTIFVNAIKAGVMESH